MDARSKAARVLRGSGPWPAHLRMREGGGWRADNYAWRRNAAASPPSS
ncbi:hypothetical protein RHECNPAF_430049 [Rhizobium etli CNPAF512]|nr:hypothetical protein RHECNPAF_430049 [Rhizobium etli CNPAF512]